MIPLPQPPKIVEKKDNSAIFEIEGLYPGYGITLGNSLRRVLLSSLPGAAATQVKIKGVQHEFATLPGVLEDVITILLNIKQLRFKLHTDEPQRVKLSAKGLKTVKGLNFDLPTQVELINKESHIATLTSKTADLEIEVLIENGLGYQPVESRKMGKLEIGTIAIDAIFTPVRKVSFQVENMRVGERTDFDKLILELETDGTLTPEEIFSQASDILVKHFSLIQESFRKPSVAKALEDKEEKVDRKQKEVRKHEKVKKVKQSKRISSSSPSSLSRAKTQYEKKKKRKKTK
ncbi:MAG: DNA-directed RNA polymerase subunit alpha [Candidatus Nealsonbacteria bacterium]|nr:DNA-directed RNA polymerase subunit alpha [Candidatus Nealsonbacteria bacterium]